MRLPVAGCRIITCSLLSTQDLLQTGRSSGVCRLRAGFVLLRHRRVLSALVALLRRVVAVAGAGLHLAAGTASARRGPGRHRVQGHDRRQPFERSEEHTSELQSLMRISYAVFCLKKKKKINTTSHKSQ